MTEIMIHMLDLLFAIIFFYLINWIGRQSVSLGYTHLSVMVKDDEAPAFNFILKTFSPVVYIIIVSSILYSFDFDYLVKNIWLVVLYYYMYRLFYNILMERFELLNKVLFFAQALISISISYLIYTKLIIHKNYLFPDIKTIGNELWIIIALFLYKVLNNIKVSEEKTRRRMKKYIHNKYADFKKQYHEIVKDNEVQEIEILLYSIMIYENFARPRFFRFGEYLLPGFRTRGIMQYRTKDRISDRESIILAKRKLLQDYENIIEEYKNENPDINMQNLLWFISHQAIYKLIEKYNRDEDYIEEVSMIYYELSETYYN